MSFERPMRPSLTKRAMSLIKIAVIVYLGYAALFFLMQRRMIFPGAHMRPVSDGRSDARLEQVWLSTSYGRVEALYLPAQGDTLPEKTPAMIFTHGNAEFIDNWPDNLGGFPLTGVSLLQIEYPGYGQSEGSPSQKSIAEAVTAAYDWLAARSDIDVGKIFVMGRSVGGGPAADLTRHRPIAALILQSTFSSVGAMAWKSYKLPPFVALDPFDHRKAIAAFYGPVLVFHGDHDDVIPYEHGVTLSTAREGVEFVTLNCAHNDCPPSWREFWSEVVRFLAGAGVLGSSGSGSTEPAAMPADDELGKP